MKPGVAVRIAAAHAVAEVAGGGSSLGRALARAVEDIAEARDQALLKALAYGTVRAYPRLLHIARQCLDRPLTRGRAELEALLCVGLCQLGGMRIATHAAVAATVEATRSLRGDAAGGLVNAVLRRYQRERARLEAQADADEEARWMHPRWLLERWREEWPQDWQTIAAAGNTEPPLWLRVNLQRIARADYSRRLEAVEIEGSASGHAPAALCLNRTCDVRELPGFDAGLASVQDAAAQLAAPLLAVPAGAHVLDACAAPGGKTAHLLELCADTRVTALDVDPQRLEQVRTNLARLGLTAELRCADAAQPATWWDGVAFDRILLDAPCTATGVIRRHPDIKLLRRAGDVDELARTQSRLLRALWPLLAPGGRLLYATCTVLRAESAGQIEHFLAGTADARALPLAVGWGRTSGAGRQTLPGEDGMDGFYYSCLEKLIPSASL